MAAYAVAHLHDVNMGADIRAYLEGIDATLAPYGGRFVIHGGPVDRLEGEWTGDLIVLEFPDRENARQWYHSPAYQALLPLRTANARGTLILIDGVPADHRATDILDAAQAAR